MGKYLRKGKAAGKIAVMEVSQGALGVRTRAKTLALVEQDRVLALTRSSSSKHPQTSARDTFHTSYLELRSRKLEKVAKEIEKSVRSHSSREGSLIEDCRSSPQAGITEAEELVCIARPEVEELSLPVHAEVVGSSPTPELSPRYVDGFRAFKDFPIDSAVSIQRASLDGAQLRCLESGPAGEESGPAGEEPVRSGNVLPERSGKGSLANTALLHGGVSVIEDGLSQDGINHGRSEVEVPCAAGEVGIPSVRRRCFRGDPVSFSSRDREVPSDIRPGSSNRTGFTVDRRMANHHRIMNRRYMRTKLFSDAKAIDELFAAPDTIEREEGKRFTERYNYDVVHDKPLKGRYEWVPAVETCSTIITPATEHLLDQQQPLRS